MALPGMIKGYLARLSHRERLIVVVGLFGGVAMLVWVLAIDPLFSGVAALEKSTERKARASSELAQVLADYQRQVKRTPRGNPTQAGKNFSLLSFLEGLSARAQVKGNIKYMRPTTSDVSEGVREHAVEIKLDAIRLEALVSLMSQVERAPHGLRVKRMRVKRRFSDANLLDVTFVVARYQDA